MTDRDGNGRYDQMVMRRLDQIHTDVAEGRRESAEFRAETTGKLAALEVKVESLDKHMTEDARKNRKLAIKAGAISGAVTSVLASLGIHLKS